MTHRVRWMVAVALVARFVAAGSAAGQESTGLPVDLRARLESLTAAGSWTVGSERILAPDVLASFYRDRAFEPAWASLSGAHGLTELVGSIRLAERHGLEPSDYHLVALERLTGSRARGQVSAAELVDLELLASDAFVALGTHLLRGRAVPAEVEAEWLARRRRADLGAVLASAVASGRVAAALYGLAPRDARYAWLVAAAQPLRDAIARGGWPTVAEGPRLELGTRDARVVSLRERLVASEDLARSFATGDVFDARVEEAVRRFQSRHGLLVDGVVGRSTLAALNVSTQERLAQVEVNLERWRWLPADLGERHIEVNVPAYELRVVEAGEVAERYRVIVGREDRRTPMVSGMLTQVVLNPYWNVPTSIAGADLLPTILANPRVLATQGFVVLDRPSGEPVDPATIDWAAVADSAAFNARYRLRQDPGPLNALGSVKFTFSNGHSIYLHDTPSQHLFERTERDFSSGCIRVQNAMDLAVYVLADSPEWTRSRLEATAESGVEVVVPLRREIPVHLMYWTAWVDDDGTLEFRGDVYERDEIVRRALTAPPQCS